MNVMFLWISFGYVNFLNVVIYGNNEVWGFGEVRKY